MEVILILPAVLKGHSHDADSLYDAYVFLYKTPIYIVMVKRSNYFVVLFLLLEMAALYILVQTSLA